MEPENRARITQEIWAIEGRAVTPNAGADRMAARTANTRSGSVSIVPETLWCRAAWKPGAEAWDGCWESMTGRLAGRRPADWGGLQTWCDRWLRGEAQENSNTGSLGVAQPPDKGYIFCIFEILGTLKILKHTGSMSCQFVLSSWMSRTPEGTKAGTQ